jgi:hypothetical protein
MAHDAKMPDLALYADNAPDCEHKVPAEIKVFVGLIMLEEFSKNPICRCWPRLDHAGRCSASIQKRKQRGVSCSGNRRSGKSAQARQGLSKRHRLDDRADQCIPFGDKSKYLYRHILAYGPKNSALDGSWRKNGRKYVINAKAGDWASPN